MTTAAGGGAACDPEKFTREVIARVRAGLETPQTACPTLREIGQLTLAYRHKLSEALPRQAVAEEKVQ